MLKVVSLYSDLQGVKSTHSLDISPHKLQLQEEEIPVRASQNRGKAGINKGGK
jgi:hypothetical protein